MAKNSFLHIKLSCSIVSHQIRFIVVQIDFQTKGQNYRKVFWYYNKFIIELRVRRVLISVFLLSILLRKSYVKCVCLIIAVMMEIIIIIFDRWFRPIITIRYICLCVYSFMETFSSS